MSYYFLSHCSSKISTCLMIKTPRKDTGGIIILAMKGQPPHFLDFISGLENISVFPNLNAP